MNGSRPELDTLVAECLDAVLLGRLTIADCLEQYPHLAADLQPALQAGLLTARLKKIEMAGETVDALEVRLRQQMADRRPRPARLPISQAAAVALLILALAFGGGAGLVRASSDSLPGDTLYGIKRLWEAVELVVAQLAGGLDELWLRLLETRLDEIDRLEAQGQLTQGALDDLRWTADEASKYANAGNAEFQSRIRDGLNRAKRRLMVSSQSPAALPSPTTATPILTPSLTYTPAPSDTPTLTDTPAPSDTPTLTRTPTATHTPTPTPTFTLTPTATLTSTATWTPLPLPELPPPGDPYTATPPPDAPPDAPPSVPPTWDVTMQVRETQRAVYLTQTAGPPRTPTPEG